CCAIKRRHTIFSRNWSSDVCSSDLAEKYRAGVGEGHTPSNHLLPGGHNVNMAVNVAPPPSTPWLVLIIALLAQIAVLAFAAVSRSEERRVCDDRCTYETRYYLNIMH